MGEGRCLASLVLSKVPLTTKNAISFCHLVATWPTARALGTMSAFGMRFIPIE
jgi:hypothetical protein